MTAFQDRYIVLIGGYQYEETYYLNATHGPSYGLPTRMCPQHTAAAQGLGCLPHCAADMPNTTYMDGPVKGANWSREYNNDGKCSRSLCVFFDSLGCAVFVYDTQMDKFGRAVATSQHDPGLILPGCGAFPINDNLPQVNVLNDTIFAVGGECNDIVIDGQSYGHYPPLALVGKVVSLAGAGAVASTAAAPPSCVFAEDLRGVECVGLHLRPAASEAACKAACCAENNCTLWQWCGDATTYCGAERGGCWTGAATTTCRRSKHCDGLDCWQGGCRGSKCPRLPPVPPPAPPPPPTCGTGGAPPCNIDLHVLGLRFDGIGGITSNGECRLLYDYPEPQRSELLDYLFLPKFGLSTQILKVEIGSDAQSTVGTEPSYQHTEGEISYDRGIQYWFMSEAKKRNPGIVIAALEWSAPSWVGNASQPEYGCPTGPGVRSSCGFFTDKNIEYILGWLHGAVDVWNISKVDYIGVWNEPPIDSIPPLWLVAFRSRLDSSGYASTQLVAPDASSTGSQVLRLLEDMNRTKALADAVDIIGTHGFWDAPPATFTELTARYPKNAKRAWVSESWHQMGTWDGAKGMITKTLAAQQQGYSGWTAWGLLFAAYPVTLCQDKGLLYSTQPWAGSYNIQPSVWTTAHFTQFSEPGWSWLAEGNGTGSFGRTENGGSSRFATLVDPVSGDWSTIVNNLDSTEATRLSFAVHGHAAGNRALSLFSTNETHWFIEQPAPMLNAAGRFTIDVAAETVYTLSTLRDAKKGEHAHSELAAPFPLPHVETFSNYSDGR